ncbi:transcriptional regulator [Metapseudomonas resinovorans]|uniref:LysR family transcriptional regulator n=1 Tax=Metapseudomonas resinovorans TaxID=53412 RepID=UPI0009848634|nr:LysR family transcriptional regulator [Pseudomonas resinovorans]GLZ89133.1 transcriptional regulator [Pseudomonas resinovorans]
MLRNVSDMDLKLLRLFSAVVKCGGFTAAQAELNVSHSNISMQISALEKRLGYRVCERGKGGFSVTEKGRIILDAALKIFEALDQFKDQAQSLSGKLMGDVYVGLADNISTLSSAHIDAAIARFYQRGHSAHLHLFVNSPAELEVAVIDKQIDVAISYFNRILPNLTYRNLYTEPVGIFCGASHALFDNDDIQPFDLEDADWIAYGFLSADLERMVRPTTSTATAYHLEAVIHAILAGTHLGFLPLHCAEPWVAQGKMRILLPEIMQQDVQHYMITSNAHPQSEAAQAFMEDLLHVHGVITP